MTWIHTFRLPRELVPMLGRSTDLVGRMSPVLACLLSHGHAFSGSLENSPSTASPEKSIEDGAHADSAKDTDPLTSVDVSRAVIQYNP